MPFLVPESLPVELLYDIQLYALSETFPFTSRHIHDIFQASSAHFRSQYLLGRVLSRGPLDVADIFTKILRYPICTEEVVQHILRLLSGGNFDKKALKFDLPRRLFRSLAPKRPSNTWEELDQPFAFLQYLFNTPGIPKPNVNSFDGYALTKAVHAKMLPLVELLLRHGAEPQCKNGLAVFVAIRQKDLTLVKLLIERDDSPYTTDVESGKRKRCKLEDRVVVSRAMLKAAVKCDAWHIVDYLAKEKGCIPDMQTLHMMSQ